MNVNLVVKILGYVCLLQALATLPGVLYTARFEHMMLPAFSFALLVAVVTGGCFLTYEYRHRHHYLRLAIDGVRQDFSVREAMAMLSCGWLLVSILGALPYWFSGHFTLIEAVFENISSITTTGVSVIPLGTHYASSLVWWHIWGQWLGGIGEIIVFVLLLARLGSEVGNLFSAEVQGVSAERTMSRAGKSVRMTCWLYAALTAVLAILLWLTGLTWAPAVQLAMVTLSTGGFVHLQNLMLEQGSWLRELIILFFMLIASLNFVLFYRVLWQGRWRIIKEDTECKCQYKFVQKVENNNVQI